MIQAGGDGILLAASKAKARQVMRLAGRCRIVRPFAQILGNEV